MSARSNRLDLLIYRDIQDIEEGDHISLHYSAEGFSDFEVEFRLKYLASKGAIRIYESVSTALGAQ